jgi:hypothetical protein
MNYYTIYEKLLISLYFLCHLFFYKISNISLFCKFLGDFFCVFVRKECFTDENIGWIEEIHLKIDKMSDRWRPLSISPLSLQSPLSQLP